MAQFILYISFLWILTTCQNSHVVTFFSSTTCKNPHVVTFWADNVLTSPKGYTFFGLSQRRRLMMKKPFNNMGVHQVQAHVIALPSEALAIEVQEIRTDVKAWIRKFFDLTPQQNHQLEILPEDFSSYLAESIADQYELRLPVPFYKEEKANQDSEDLKEIIINGRNQVTYTLEEPSKVAVPDFGIWIRYQQIL